MVCGGLNFSAFVNEYHLKFALNKNVSESIAFEKFIKPQLMHKPNQIAIDLFYKEDSFLPEDTLEKAENITDFRYCKTSKIHPRFNDESKPIGFLTVEFKG